MSPSFGLREMRRSTMVSSSSTNTSKSCPGSKCNCSRTALGRTIWPFLESTVVIVGKSYTEICLRQRPSSQVSRIGCRTGKPRPHCPPEQLGIAASLSALIRIAPLRDSDPSFRWIPKAKSIRHHLPTINASLLSAESALQGKKNPPNYACKQRRGGFDAQVLHRNGSQGK